MPLLAPTTDRLVSLPATLGVSSRLVGTFLAGRTGVSGVVVVVSDGGRGRFTYPGPVQWWLQLRVPCTLTVDGRAVAVRVLGHRLSSTQVEIDFVGPTDVPLLTSATRALVDEQDRLDLELGAYWSTGPGRQPPEAATGSPPAPGSASTASGLSSENRRRLAAIGAVLDAVATPIYVLGPDGTYLGANQAFLDHARRRLDEVVGRRPAEVWTDGRRRPAAAEERTVDLPDVGVAVVGSFTDLGSPMGPPTR